MKITRSFTASNGSDFKVGVTVSTTSSDIDDVKKKINEVEGKIEDIYKKVKEKYDGDIMKLSDREHSQLIWFQEEKRQLRDKENILLGASTPTIQG